MLAFTFSFTLISKLGFGFASDHVYLLKCSYVCLYTIVTNNLLVIYSVILVVRVHLV